MHKLISKDDIEKRKDEVNIPISRLPYTTKFLLYRRHSNTDWLSNRQQLTKAAQTITWRLTNTWPQLQSSRLETLERCDAHCHDVTIVNPLPAYIIHYMQDNENRYTWLNSNIWRTNHHRVTNLVSLDRALQCGGQYAAILSLFILRQKLHRSKIWFICRRRMQT